MKTNFTKMVLSIFLALVFSPVFLFSQYGDLVDFGANASANTFGISGWNELLLDSRMVYSSEGPGGVVLGSDFDIFTDYMGVRGSERKFNHGERIVATWHNTSGQAIIFHSRISFTDPDNPDEEGAGGAWYTMRNFEDYRYGYVTIEPGGTARTVFNIEEEGVHKTDGNYSVVNINLMIEWYESALKQYLVCDKIELLGDADIEAPQAPTGLTASAISDNEIRLDWDVPADNTGAVEYRVYLGDELEGYTRENSFDAVFLQAGTEYSFTVTAFDHCRNESAHSAPVVLSTMPFRSDPSLINPGGFEYMGALRLPEDVAWGGEGITYNPDGDGGQSGSGAADGHPGSVFISDLNQPARGFVGELSLPAPIISSDINALNEAVVVQAFADIRPSGDNWSDVDIWRNGLCYYNPGGASQPILYSSWGYHYEVQGEKLSSLSCCLANDLAGSTKNGTWYLGQSDQPPIGAALNDYLFKAPDDWAAANCSGRSIITGRFRDGGLSGLGPTFFAFSPVDISSPPAHGAELEFTTLLQYGPYVESDYKFPNAIDAYNHNDWWNGADWLTAGQQQAVLITGNKGQGHFWYGYYGEETDLHWIDADLPMPHFDESDPFGKGWRSSNLSPMIILYSTDDLARIARGEAESWEAQPYGAVRITKDLFYGHLQEIRSACFDPINGYLYITEFVLENDGYLVLHVWQVNEVGVSVADMHKTLPKLEVYPNPGQGEFWIKIPKEVDNFFEYVIYDNLGRNIRKGNANYKGRDYQLKIDNQPAGVYYLIITAGDSKYSAKIIIK